MSEVDYTPRLVDWFGAAYISALSPAALLEHVREYAATAEGSIWRFRANLLSIAAELERHWWSRWYGRRIRRSAESIWANRQDLFR